MLRGPCGFGKHGVEIPHTRLAVDDTGGMANQGPALEQVLARPHGRLVVDLGCGDGRATARLAAREPEALVIGVDANLDAAERVVRRARRAPGKGGVPNLAFVRAAADRLPAALEGRVDELRIDLPWGSLLDGLLSPDPVLVAGIARLLAPGGRLRVVLNAGALPDELSQEQARDRLRETLVACGLTDVRVDATATWPETGWGKRLTGGRPLRVVVAEAGRPATPSIASSP